MRRVLLTISAFAAGTLMIVSPAVSQPPEGKGGKGGGKGGPPRFELGRVLPPPLREELNLTADQVKELDAIEADVKAKLNKLLTDEQKKVAESFRPRGPGGPGDKGGKGPPFGDKGGKGPPPGDKGGDRQERPPVE